MLLRTLCSGLQLCRIGANPTTSAAPAVARFSSGANKSAPPPAHWDRSGTAAGTEDAAVVSSSSGSDSSIEHQPPPAGVAAATHMLLNQPVYNVLGDVVPVNEYHLAEQVGSHQYYTLPIIYLSAKRNNCIVTLTDGMGRTVACTSTGIEGFINAKKSTTVAAQIVGVSIGLKAKKLGMEHVRVVIRGMNPLRLSCLKGMASTGLQIASVTDNTKIHYGKGRRPRKPPRK